MKHFTDWLTATFNAGRFGEFLFSDYSIPVINIVASNAVCRGLGTKKTSTYVEAFFVIPLGCEPDQ